MKYLFILLLAFLVSCGDNHGGDNDEITNDTTLTPPTDTLGVDSVENIEAVGRRKGVKNEQIKSIVYYQLVKRTLKYKL